MIIKELKLTDFAAFHSPSSIKFEDGLTVLQGPNEAGKSSLMNSIRLALFYKPNQDNPVVRSAIQRYGKGSRYIIEVRYEVDGEEYRLIKDFERKTAELYLPPHGDRNANADRIQQLLLEAVGLPEEDYLRTALIQQRDLAFEKADDLVQRLQRILVGGEVEAASIRSSLEEARKQLLRKIHDKRGSPGIVLNCLKKLASIKNEYSELKERIEQSVSRQESRQALKRKLDLIEQGGDGKPSLSKLNEKLQKAKALRIHVANRNKANDTLDWIEKAEKAYQSLQETEKALKKLREEKIPAAQKEFSSAKEHLEAAASFQKVQEELIQAKKDLKRSQKIQETIDELKDEIAKKEKVLSKMTEATESDLTNARKAHQNIEVAQASIRSLSARTRLESLKKNLIIKTSADEEGPTEETIGLGDVREHDVAQFFEAEIQDVVRFSVKLPDTEELEKSREQVKTHEATLSSVLQKFKVESVEILEEAVKVRQVLEGELRELNSKKSSQIATFKEVFSEKTEIADLEEEVKSKKVAVENSQTLLKEFKGEPPSPDAVQVLEKKFKELKEKRSNLREKRVECQTNLNNSLTQLELADYDKKELERRRKEARTLLLKAEEGIEAIGENVELSEEVDNLEKESNDLEEQKSELREKIARLEGPEEENLAGEEALNEPIEETIRVYEEVREHRRMEAVITRALEILDRAQQTVIPAAQREVANRVAVHMTTLTNGRYDSVIWKGFDTLDLRLSGDRLPEEGLPLTSDFLSGGTCDQFYFSARLALLDYLAGDRCPPLLLDDPFSEFDPERRAQAISILKELCTDSDRQILLFTCQDYYQGLVKRVVDVSLVKG